MRGNLVHPAWRSVRYTSVDEVVCLPCRDDDASYHPDCSRGWRRTWWRESVGYHGISLAPDEIINGRGRFVCAQLTGDAVGALADRSSKTPTPSPGCRMRKSRLPIRFKRQPRSSRLSKQLCLLPKREPRSQIASKASLISRSLITFTCVRVR